MSEARRRLVRLHTGEVCTAGEVCRRAADLIERHGWVRGAFRGESGEMCALGALRAVVTDGTYIQASGIEGVDRAAACLNVPRVGRWATTNVLRWNDRIHRTKQDVLDTLRFKRAKVPA